MSRTKRVARMCPKAPECGWREFDNPTAVCPTHGKGIEQKNKPYNVAQAKAEKKKA